MGLVDRGGAQLRIYPEVESVDGYGNTLRQPGPTSVTVTAQAQRQSSTESATEGQSVGTTVRIWARSLPTGPWGRVVWAGRDWDVVGEVERRRDGSPATWHDVVLLRARDAGPLRTA